MKTFKAEYVNQETWRIETKTFSTFKDREAFIKEQNDKPEVKSGYNNAW